MSYLAHILTHLAGKVIRNTVIRHCNLWSYRQTSVCLTLVIAAFANCHAPRWKYREWLWLFAFILGPAYLSKRAAGNGKNKRKEKPHEEFCYSRSRRHISSRTCPGLYLYLSDADTIGIEPRDAFVCGKVLFLTNFPAHVINIAAMCRF